MDLQNIWQKENILYLRNEIHDVSEEPDVKTCRGIIEPWLTAVFQSEHLSLLTGSGLTKGIYLEALKNSKNSGEVKTCGMDRTEYDNYCEVIKKYADKEAEKFNRGKANFEDDLRVAMNLLKGLEIQKSEGATELKKEVNKKLAQFINHIIRDEGTVLNSKNAQDALMLLRQFLISFSSRTSTRDRLHIFTTNYDRFIEYALDKAGIYTLDRFVGKLIPTMRMHKMELDYHYNPPGIRGEPRYVDGVVRYTKLHGSVDWRFKEKEIHKVSIPFGCKDKDVENLIQDPYDTCVIYPTSSKGIETAYFPYSELFRDFSTAICRPNSSLVIFGYGFGDSHINSIILDMMSIPSTHLVVIAYEPKCQRLQSFIKDCNCSQLTLLAGKHFGDIRILTENYLPKSAIDRITDRYFRIKEKRDVAVKETENIKGEKSNAEEL